MNVCMTLRMCEFMCVCVQRSIYIYLFIYIYTLYYEIFICVQYIDLKQRHNIKNVIIQHNRII